MRITLLGHASVLVELDGTTCLVDPVLDDPFEEGTVVSCPSRAVDVDQLPQVEHPCRDAPSSRSFRRGFARPRRARRRRDLST
jgi:hypothetical protein